MLNLVYCVVQSLHLVWPNSVFVIEFLLLCIRFLEPVDSVNGLLGATILVTSLRKFCRRTAESWLLHCPGSNSYI